MFKSLFKRKEKPLTTEEVLVKARAILPLLDGLVNKVFTEFNSELISHNPEVVVPAVWGTDRKGNLTPFQSQIHELVKPVVIKLMASFDHDKLQGADRFAVECLVRELIIAKIAFMMEGTKNRLMRELVSEDPVELYSQQIQTVGTA